MEKLKNKKEMVKMEKLTINNLFELEEKKVKEKIKEALNFDWIEKEVNKTVSAADITKQLDGNHYQRIIDILISDRAGQYQELELLEKFSFNIDEKSYKENREEFIEFINYYFFGYIEKVLKNNIELDGGLDLLITYENGDIVLLLIVDYDYMPTDAEVIEKVDQDLLTNLIEGYPVIIDQDKLGFEVLHSFYCQDSEKFFYNNFYVYFDDIKAGTVRNGLVEVMYNINDHITKGYKEAESHLHVLIQGGIL